MAQRTKKTSSSVGMYSSKNKKNPFAAKYKNAKASASTKKTNYQAPAVRNLYSREGIKDYQSSLVTNQVYQNEFGHQGNFLGFSTRWQMAQAAANDKAQLLTYCVQGTNNQGRLGNRVIAKSVNLIMNISRPPFSREDSEKAWASAVDNTGVDVEVLGFARSPYQARVIIFIDMGNNLQVPTINDMLEAGTISAGNTAGLGTGTVPVATITSQLRTDATTRFKVLYNDMISLSTDQYHVTYTKYIPLEGLGITYKNSNADPNQVNNNGVWMFVLGPWTFEAAIGADDAERATVRNYSSPRFDYTSKFRFSP